MNDRLQLLWGAYQKHLSPLQQARVRQRVVNDEWTLEKAITNEGLMLVHSNIDSSGAKEAFESGELAVDATELEKLDKAVDEILVDEKELERIKGAHFEVTVIDEALKGDSFIPRPK